MRVGFKTNLEESLIKDLKKKALDLGVNVNDILEKLAEMFLEYLEENPNQESKEEMES